MGKLFLEGFLLQASLIFALGAQNLFVLEAGLRKNHHLMVSLACFLCDLTLILLGVAGAATVFNQFPILKFLVGLLGVVFLFLYGLGKIFPSKDECQTSSGYLVAGLKRSILLSITFSLLNPHAYLDAFILIGGFASKYIDLKDRVVFGLGAAFYSGIWFLALSTFATFLRPWLNQPAKLRAVMSLAGVFLIFLSLKLGGDLVSWIPKDLLPELSHKNMYSYPLPPGHVFTSILY